MDANELSRKTAIVEKALKAIEHKLVVDIELESVNDNVWHSPGGIEVKIKYKSVNNPNWIPLEYVFGEKWFSQELWMTSRSSKKANWQWNKWNEIEKLVPSKKYSYMNDTQLAILRIAAFYYLEFVKRNLINPNK